jgi:hypothetical protein
MKFAPQCKHADQRASKWAILLSAGLSLFVLSGCLSDSETAAPRRLFATSQAYTGDFGGVQAADSICNTLAKAAILGGTWKSFLSDSSAGALARLQEVGPWYRVEATGLRTTKVFNNRTGFTVGALASVNNEYGAALPTNIRVWTGTRADGLVDGSQTCSNWTSTVGYGTDGNPNALLANGPKWMYSAEGAAPCTLAKRLYCFEQ